MAEATFVGRTKLDTKGMREGFARVKAMSAKTAKNLNRAGGKTTLAHAFGDFQRSAASAFGAIRFQLKSFNRAVTANVLKAASSFARLAKGAALAGGAVAAIGVAKNFKTEALEAQFATIIGDADEARDRVAALQRQAANTAFDPTDYITAYKTLLTTANGELATGSMMQGIGDAAAVAGKQVNEVATEVTNLYNSLKAGKGGGGGAKQLLKDSIITLETYKYIDRYGKDASKVGDVWARVTKDLNNFAGGMEHMKRTGSGAIAMLRNMAGLALQETFRGFAEVIKDVLYNINELLSVLNSSGRFAVLGQELGSLFREICNVVYQATLAFRNMDDVSRRALKNLLIAAGVVAVAMHSGILVPLLKATAAFAVIAGKIIAQFVTFAVSSFAVIGKAFAALAVAMIGFNIGNAIFAGLPEAGKKAVEFVATVLDSVVSLLWGFHRMHLVPLWETIKQIFTDPLNFDPKKIISTNTKEWNSLVQTAKDKAGQFSAVLEQQGEAPKSWDEAFQSLPKKFAEALMDIQGKLKDLDFGALLKDFVLPPSVKAFIEQLNKLRGVSMPSMPKPPDMSKARIDAEAIADANRKANAYTIRGYYFRKLDMAAIIANAKNNSKLAEHNRKRELDAQKKAQSKQTLKPIETEFQRSNRLLEDIKRNTGKNSGAVYA